MATVYNPMQSFIESCTPVQLSQLAEAIHALQPRPESVAPNAASSMRAKAGVRTGKKQRNKNAATGGPKRPLNSWMAFRKYYNASLAPHTQKTISKVMTNWWRADPFEAKWAMLAKAYSIVRGSREKEDVPLDGFFEICAPLIGVIPPNEYQQRMGWQLIPARADDEDKMPQLTRLFTPEMNTFSDELTTTSLSVDDLVTHCYNVGYVKAWSTETSVTNTTGSLTMAVQPTAGGATRTHNISQAQYEMMQPITLTTDKLSQALVTSLTGPPAGEMSLSNATTAINDMGVSYPYNSIIDPTNDFDIDFNPNAGEQGDAWDSFDLDRALNDTTVGELDWSLFVNDDQLI